MAAGAVSAASGIEPDGAGRTEVCRHHRRQSGGAHETNNARGGILSYLAARGARHQNAQHYRARAGAAFAAYLLRRGISPRTLPFFAARSFSHKCRASPPFCCVRFLGTYTTHIAYSYCYIAHCRGAYHHARHSLSYGADNVFVGYKTVVAQARTIRPWFFVVSSITVDNGLHSSPVYAHLSYLHHMRCRRVARDRKALCAHRCGWQQARSI
jgi:hypothetical protein